MGIALWIAVGAALSSIARWVMPGPDPAGTLWVTVLGAAAGLLGGVIGSVVGNVPWSSVDPRALLMSVISSLVVLMAYRSYAMRWAA
jgi:uncharacterized membrane protein YeaQ/YmgE (transglycosylase-associated protein family)